MSKNREKGNFAEDIAANFLEKRGYILLDRNYYCPEGELDIVALQGEWLVFIEVKSVSAFSDYSIFGRISKEKRIRIQKATFSWLEAHKKVEALWRCDFIGIEIAQSLHRIHHFKFLSLNEEN